jgi:CheY-like chemotaxis protein
MRLPEQMMILVVEDQDDDIVLIRRAFHHAGVKNPIFVVNDGREAREYLEGFGKYRNRDEYPLPELILLDLKMPKMGGFELLKWIRAQPALKALRLVVLTSSEDIYEINKAYEMGANSFLVKPFDFEDYTSMMRTLSSFWMTHSMAPNVQRPPKEEQTKKKGGNN